MNNKGKYIKTKEDVKSFFKRIIDDKNAWIDCVSNDRYIAELKERGIKVADLNKILN